MIPAIFLCGLFLTLFVTSYTGLYKSWYITRPIATMFHPNMIYGTLPIGLGLLYLLIMRQLPTYPESFNPTIFIGLVLLGLVFRIWSPSFLKPKWVKLIEQDYGYCLPILIEEARKLGRWQWESRVRTPAQMQSWLDQTLTHRQTDIDPLWQEYRRHMQRKYGKGNFHIPQHRRKQ